MKEQNTIPANSMLEKSELKFDYIDNYNIQLTRNNVESWEPIVAFFACSPNWLNSILNLRNKFIRRFNLKSEIIDLQKLSPPFEINSQCGTFKLYDMSVNESILGDDNFHLDFRMSLYVDDSHRLHITTAIKFNNIFGKIYLSTIKAFHKWIVKAMLKKMLFSIDNLTLPQHNLSKI